MKRIALICPNIWDHVQLPSVRQHWRGKYAMRSLGEDAEDSLGTFDAISFIGQAIDTLRRTGIDGVASSSDYPGCLVAAAVARELRLPGPDPLSVLRCSHKYYSRLAQSVAVPDATPRYTLIDPRNLSPTTLGLSFPMFVKPVKSWFSQYARRVDTFEQLVEFVGSQGVLSHLSNHVAPFNQMIETYTDFVFNGSYMLAEEVLTGSQVTLEGYVRDGKMTVIGVVDSVMYPDTISFERFDYPTAITYEIVDRMTSIADTLLRYIGFDNSLFNIELFYDWRTDGIHIIEINPRMCGQFADLMHGVNGTSTYEVLVALAAGDPPPPVYQAGYATFRVAASFVLRSFEDAVVARIPARGRVRNIQREHPVTFVSSLYKRGERLSVRSQENDGASYRYAVINMLGSDRASLLREFAVVREKLGFTLTTS